MPDNNSQFMLYIGSCMDPALKMLDILYIVPYNGKKIRCGDVITFIPPEENRKITHRVVSIGERGIRTRGDKNTQLDPWSLCCENIIGKVIWARRGGDRVYVYGRLTGSLLAVSARISCLAKSAFILLFRLAYRRLAQTGLIGRLTPMCIKKRTFFFNRANGIEEQLFVGRHMVARRVPGKYNWQIQTPFKLFISERYLPK